MSKQRTITLTGRPPVKIDEDSWPVIAKGSGDSFSGNDYGRHQPSVPATTPTVTIYSFSGNDYGRHQQASGQGELDEYNIRVRQHADGRAIVYAVFSGAKAWTGNGSRAGGVLLDAGADLAGAIERVGEDVGVPDSVIRECVADLPAEELA